jgi:hypothetical protein
MNKQRVMTAGPAAEHRDAHVGGSGFEPRPGCQAHQSKKYPYKHGGKGTQLYTVWKRMVSRCHYAWDKSYPNYGGRGIKVCQAWREDFASFRDYIGARPSPTHTIDRINNDGDYEPGNIRWASKGEQRRNSRRILLVEYMGKKMCCLDAAKLIGMTSQALSYRIRKKGMTVEQAAEEHRRANGESSKN